MRGLPNDARKSKHPSVFSAHIKFAFPNASYSGHAHVPLNSSISICAFGRFGNVSNKPFFFALIDFLEASGYPCDMRGKIKIV